jgi:hypothetical protein
MIMSKQQPWTARKRVVSALRNEHVRVEERPGVGRAVFAARAFSPGECVASYQGRVITRAQLAVLHGSDRPLFESVTEYAVSSSSGDFLYPENLDAAGAHLINHSCAPNAQWAEYERGALLVRATRPIAEGEEITIHYGWVGIKAAKEKNWHTCVCAAPFCVGTIELRVEWVEEDGGPFLAEEEIARRLFADIVNDTDDHEAVLLRYARGSSEMTPDGTTVPSSLDPGAFLDKLRGCAHAAVRAALHSRTLGKTVSDRRLRQIAATYGVPLEAERTG